MPEIDCTTFFDALNPRVRTRDKVSIEIDDHTYLPEGELLDGWLPRTREAFRLLARSAGEPARTYQSMGIVGCGPGVDAALAVELLDPTLLVLMDLRQDIVNIAVENVRRNCIIRPGNEVTGYESDLCGALRRMGKRVDLIYENLPNLPALKGLTLDHSALTASFYDDSTYAPIPKEYDRLMLGLHYRFLVEARECLEPGGQVISCVGGRVPFGAIESMFLKLGYRPSLLVTDIVRQFEAERLLPQYSYLEQQTGMKFRFLPLEAGKATFAQLRDAGVASGSIAEELHRRGAFIDAHDANVRQMLGKHIGVVGFVIQASLT